MLHDRDYMRTSPDGSRQGSFLRDIKNWSAVKTLIIINIVFFLLQVVIVGTAEDSIGRSYYYDLVFHHCYLSSTTIKNGEVWRLISHLFVHASFFHIFFNMLVLAIFGKVVEQRIGKKRFYLLYFFAGLIAALVYLSVNWRSGTRAVGASGAIMGIFMSAALYMPTMPIYLFFIPIPIKIWKFVKWYAGFSFVLLLFRSFAGMNFGLNWAHSAHLGGILGGYLYLKYFLQVKGPSIDFSKWFSTLKNKRKTKGFTHVKKRKKTGSYTKGESTDSSLEDVDRILDKISNLGMGSLTEEEKTTLENARKNLRR